MIKRNVTLLILYCDEMNEFDEEGDERHDMD